MSLLRQALERNIDRRAGIAGFSGNARPTPPSAEKLTRRYQGRVNLSALALLGSFLSLQDVRFCTIDCSYFTIQVRGSDENHHRDAARFLPCFIHSFNGGVAMKILLAVDGSTFSQAAAESMANRPLPPNSEVKIITVIEPFQPYMAETWAMPADFYDDLESSAKARADDDLNKAMKAFQPSENKGVTVTTEAIRGYAKGAIVDEAERWGADLVVVGSHGYTGFRRLLLGSVSQAVASHAPCSVEIVRLPH
jgi:nucleotide-binding universal stress UspA family protein